MKTEVQIVIESLIEKDNDISEYKVKLTSEDKEFLKSVDIYKDLSNQYIIGNYLKTCLFFYPDKKTDPNINNFIYFDEEDMDHIKVYRIDFRDMGFSKIINRGFRGISFFVGLNDFEQKLVASFLKKKLKREDIITSRSR